MTFDLDTAIGLAKVQESVDRIDTRLTNIETKIESFERDRNRAAGGLAVLAVVSTTLGWFLSKILDISELFGKVFS